jgi:hypothetical protein
MFKLLTLAVRAMVIRLIFSLRGRHVVAAAAAAEINKHFLYNNKF